MNNPLNLRGIEFTEYATNDAEHMHNVFVDLGFSLLKKWPKKEIYYYKQNDIHILLNKEKESFAAEFSKKHGPSIPSMGWRVDDAQFAYNEAIKRGARPCEGKKDYPYPAIMGIGGSLIYFVDRFQKSNNIYDHDFVDMKNPVINSGKGFLRVDHLTNNVYKGTMEEWAKFYKEIFGFVEIRYFDIEGKKTGLTSYALRSPDGSFCIPINEGKDDNNNQIDEYLDLYDGPGVQHIAFLTEDILFSLDQIVGKNIQMLDINDDYYDTVYDRVPKVTEDRSRIKKHQVLVDGDERGYLLQIFTKNLFGPIFYEIIQRKNNLGFGEGNFQALFNSIERDQEQRGVI